MRDWKREFENKFVEDDILDCIPRKNWEEMRDEIFGFIEAEQKRSYDEGEQEGLETGYNDGFKDGEDIGHDYGYDEGYSDCEIEHGLV